MHTGDAVVQTAVTFRPQPIYTHTVTTYFKNCFKRVFMLRDQTLVFVFFKIIFQEHGCLQIEL